MEEFSKKVVKAVILMNVLFVAVVLWLFYRTAQEPTATIAAWFAFTTGELWALGKIKRAKIEYKPVVSLGDVVAEERDEE